MKNLILKILFISFAFITYNSQSFSHSLNGKYLCRTSSFSPFRTEVEVTKFKKHCYFDSLTFKEDCSKMSHASSDVYFDGKYLMDAGTEHYIKNTNKIREYIQIRHNTYSGIWVSNDGKERDLQGVTYTRKKKEFSEKSGYKWVTERFVFCEKVE